MITSLREKDYQAKKEGESKFSKEAAAAPSTSRQWSAFRNPRIVRVSRNFGGKDRHSKVCTIRGLRDRRIRLSVPTAIQLYDLQDRLGLGQPSKVIDWLIDVTKSDIDKLPPLSLPQGFGQFQHHPALMFSQESSNVPRHQSPLAPFFEANSTFMKDARFHSSLELNINNGEHHHLHGEEHQHAWMKSKHWEVEASSLRAKSKVVEDVIGKGKWIKGNDLENNQDGVIGKLFPLSSTQSNSLPGLLNNPTLPFNSYYHWDASNLSLSQFGSHGFLPQPENSINTNAVPLPLSSSLVLPSGPQLFFCPPPTMPSLIPSFPPYNVTPPVENDHSRGINHFQLLGPSSQHFLPNFRASTKPFSLNANPDKDNSSS